MPFDKPTQDDEPIGYKIPKTKNNRFIIKKDEIDNIGLLHEFHHSEMGHVANLFWVGEKNGFRLRQLALVPNNEEKMLFLSYEGIAWYKEKAYSNDIAFLRKDDIIMPRDGSVIEMAAGKYHFFNSRNAFEPNLGYSLDVNNASIILNNISIYDENYQKGCMINLRASFEGNLDREDIQGNVHILFVSDEI